LNIFIDAAFGTSADPLFSFRRVVFIVVFIVVVVVANVVKVFISERRRRRLLLRLLFKRGSLSRLKENDDGFQNELSEAMPLSLFFNAGYRFSSTQRRPRRRRRRRRRW